MKQLRDVKDLTIHDAGIISGPQPWHYVHCYLPGGTESLGKPGFELRIGAPLPHTGLQRDFFNTPDVDNQ